MARSSLPLIVVAAITAAAATSGVAAPATSHAPPPQDFPIARLQCKRGPRLFHLNSPYGFVVRWEHGEASFYLYDKGRTNITVTRDVKTFTQRLSSLPDQCELAWVNTCGAPLYEGMPTQMLSQVQQVLGSKRFKMAGIEQNNFVLCTCEATNLAFFSTAPSTKTASAQACELSRIEHFSPKGRAQDKSYNPEQPVIDHLLAKGKECLPLLIDTLDNDTEIDHQIIDYWPHNTIGDIAFVILTDLTTDSSWRKSTIPGGSWNEILGSKPNNDILLPAFNQLTDFKQHHGSIEIKRRWQALWSRHQNQIYWDQRDKCFKLPEVAH
jgi:hypothetical protein